jgi:aminoglycoside phosphotransferase (APT) family kinase protein
MADTELNELQEEIVLPLLARVMPVSSLLNVELLPGSFSNHTHLVEARPPDGKLHRIVVRRYKIFGDYDRGEKARREFKTFELLNQNRVPTPQALLLDETGEILGAPGIVTRFVEGSFLLEAPANVMGWARKLAGMLAKIHSIPCGKEEQSFLLKGNAEASWFLKSDSPPKYIQEYPGGADLWQMLRELYPNIRGSPIPFAC